MLISHWTASWGYSALTMSVVSAGGGSGKKALVNSCVLLLFVAAVSLSVGMYCCVGIEFIYFLTFQIVLSSAVSTKFLHVCRCASFSFCWYFLSHFLHSFP